MVPEIKLDELKARMDRGDRFVLLEALQPWKYHNQHLPGAINVPFDRIAKYAPRRIPDKNTDIVVYCGAFT
jgi:rhodanese-related sulfurtransferase